MTTATPAETAHLVVLIRDALAQDEGELGISVQVEDDIIRLSGVVQSDQRRQRIEELSGSLGEGYRLVNEIRVCPPGSADAAEEIS